jgi:DNA-binding SARP family transcriptional activator/tetratricopeptide (TPR) repeat protein
VVPHLHLLTLGAPLLLTEAGEQVRFRTRKHFALLIRLAVEAGRKLTRDYLMDLLWPDVPAPRARHSLAQALTVLKAKIGRERLVVQRASIGLAAGAVDADVQALESCAAQIRGPFLDGLEVPGAVQFEQWKDEWRAKLMPQIRDCLVKQMDAARRTGNFETVEKHAHVLLELDPLSEDAVRGVMEARAWVGDRSNALKVYGRFAARLTEELGAKPSPDLVRIADLLREGRRAAPRPARVGQVSERHERRFEPETLVGREREFAHLYDTWLAVRRREPRIVVLLGDPGVGKTTLTNAFVSTCQMEGAAIARAQAYDAERELPFGVLAELVKQLTLQRAIGGADPEALSELSRVSPEIFAVFPGVPKPVEWSAEVIPLRLADALLKAVEAAAEESPLVLVVDDIHAADNATVAILHVVARKLPRARLLLILTARSNELRTAAGPSALVSDGAIGVLGTLELEPLPPAAAERLVAARVARAGARIADVPVPRIVQAGNGNPLAVELLTGEWLAHGSASLLSDLEALNTQPVATLGIPRAIEAVFERQVGRLDARTRAVLDLAAVLGRRLADLPLYQAVELSAAAAGEALSRLKEEGLLREVQGGLEFRNELIRAQAYYAVAGPARQHLHGRVGEVLGGRSADRGKSNKALELEVAWHFLRGGDVERALAAGRAGAEAALKAGAPVEAERILGALLCSSLESQIAQELRLLQAKALVDQSKAEDALPILERLCGDQTLSTKNLAEASRMRAASLYLLNRESAASYRKAAEMAVAIAQQTGDVELNAEALLEYARCGAETGDEACVRGAERDIREILNDGTAQRNPMVWYALGFCEYFFFDADAAAQCIERSISLLTDSPNAVALSLAYNALGVCRYNSCDFRGAQASLRTALGLAQRMGDDSRLSVTAANLCALHTLEGNFDDAVVMGLESVAKGGRLSGQPRLTNAYFNLAEAYMLLGQREDALACLDSAKKLTTQTRSWRSNVEFLCESANLALMMRNVALALDLIGSVEEIAAGRERAVPEPGMFEKLRVFRTAHHKGHQAAASLAAQAQDRFRDRHRVDYMQALAAKAWLESCSSTPYSPQTQAELTVFGTLGAHGLRASLTAQGFLA